MKNVNNMKNVNDIKNVNSVKNINSTANGKFFVMNSAKLFIACLILANVLTGCSISNGAGYTREELGNLAKLEIYDAENDTLMKTIEDEETIYQYNHMVSKSEETYSEWAKEASEEAYEWAEEITEEIYAKWGTEVPEDIYDELKAEMPEDYEEIGKQLKEAAEDAGERYYIIAYKYPTAKFGAKEPEKNFTLTLYKDANIAKMTVAEENIKNISLPEEFLIFYYEMSEEEMEFYMSLIS